MDVLGVASSTYSPLDSVVALVALFIIAYVLHFVFEHGLRFLVRKTDTKLDDQVIAQLKHPVFWSLVLAGFYYIIQPLVTSQARMSIYRNVLITVGVLIWAIVGSRVVGTVFGALERRVNHGTDDMLKTLSPFLGNIAKLVILSAVVIGLLSLWGIDITPALASAGVVGVAVAFAARDTVANLFGGISVFLDKPYKIGDYVIVNEAHRGEVIDIGMRSTKIRTRDNVLLTVPNAVMVTNAVINETGFDPKFRVRVPLQVAYGSNLARVEKILIDTAAANDVVLDHPAPRVRYRAFADSGIELELMGMIAKPSKRGEVVHTLIKEIDRVFKKEHITIPFPQRDVHLHKAS